jgi:hypothetical protein
MLALETWQHDTNSRVGASTGGGAKKGIMGAGNAYHRRVFKSLAAHVSFAHPDFRLLVEPWLRSRPSYRLCQPDSVLLAPDESWAVVIEVKKNWKDGRDQKLLDLYLPAVRSAFGLDAVFPLMICGCVRGLQTQALTSLRHLVSAPKLWQPGDPTPVILSI